MGGTFDYQGPRSGQQLSGSTARHRSAAPTPKRYSANAYLLDNTSNDTLLDFSQDETISLHQSRSTQTSSEISVDIGSKTTGTIGGDDFGAKLEQEISANFGWKTDETNAEEESKDQSTTRHIATICRDSQRHPRHNRDDTRITSATPFTAHGPWTAGVTLALRYRLDLRRTVARRMAPDRQALRLNPPVRRRIRIHLEDSR